MIPTWSGDSVRKAGLRWNNRGQTQYCSLAKNTRLALSLSKGLMAGPFDRLRANGADERPPNITTPVFTFLSGPEGGLTSTEETAALSAGFTPVTLGPRVLRAETAPLAALAALTLGA